MESEDSTRESKKKNIQIRDNQVLNNYIKELGEDLSLTTMNLREKSLTCSGLWGKWLSYLFLEKENLGRISEAKQKIMKKKMSQTKVTDSVLRMKSEDKIAENDDTVKKLNALHKQTQDNIDFIERALSILSNFGFSIKNSIDALKLNMNH